MTSDSVCSGQTVRMSRGSQGRALQAAQHLSGPRVSTRDTSVVRPPPTWAPFRLQFYCNGHNALAVKLARAGIAYQLVDNAFIDIADFPRAQVLAEQIRVEKLHHRLGTTSTTSPRSAALSPLSLFNSAPSWSPPPSPSCPSRNRDHYGINCCRKGL